MALREVFGHFGFTFDDAKMRQANAGMDQLAGAVTALGAVWAGSEIFQGLNTLAERLDVFDDLSAQTRLATDDIQLLTYAAELNGASAAEMVNSLTLLQKSLGRTNEATSTQVEALQDLGISMKDAAGGPRTLADVLPEILTNFSNLKSEADEARVATDLFGRGGIRLLPTLRRGQEGFEALRRELEEFGGPAGEDAIKAAGEFRDSVVRMDRALFSLKGVFAAQVFPQLEKIVRGVARGVGWLSRFAAGTTLADSAALALSATLGVKLAGALAPYLKAGLKFAAIFAAVDEVVAFLRGKDSLIGRALDAAFGEGASEKVRTWVNNAIADLGLFSASAEAAFQAATNAQESATAQWLAGVTMFVRDAAAGFPALRSGLASVLAEMSHDVQLFIYQTLLKWNGFVDSLTLPDSVKAALKIDATGVGESTAEAGRRSVQYAKETVAYNRGYRGPSDPAAIEKFLAERDAAVRPTAAPGLQNYGGTLPGPALPFGVPATPLPGLGGGPYLPPAPVAPVVEVQAPQTITQTTTINVNGARDPRAVAGEVVKGQTGVSRAAQQALTQRR